MGQSNIHIHSYKISERKNNIQTLSHERQQCLEHTNIRLCYRSFLWVCCLFLNGSESVSVKRGGWDSINRLEATTFLCLFKDRTHICIAYAASLRVLWFEVRGSNSFCRSRCLNVLYIQCYTVSGLSNDITTLLTRCYQHHCIAKFLQYQLSGQSPKYMYNIHYEERTNNHI